MKKGQQKSVSKAESLKRTIKSMKPQPFKKQLAKIQITNVRNGGIIGTTSA